MSTTPAPLNDLVGKIRAKYPGAYDDMDDATLTKAVLAKYPQYSDLAAPKISKPPINIQYSNQTALQEEGMTTDPKMGQMMSPQSLSPDASIAAGGIAGVEAGTLGAYGLGQAALPVAAAGAKKVLPYVVKAGQWAEANPSKAKLITDIIKHSAVGGGYAAVKKALDILSPTK